MSATAALDARQVLEAARSVVAVELLAATEAAEYLDDDLALGTGTAAVYDAVREVVEPLEADRRLDGDIAAVDALLEAGLLAEAVADAGIDWPERSRASVARPER